LSTTADLVSEKEQETELINPPSNWERKPEDKDELECVVEWEPVHGVDGALKDGQEREDDPIL
jgi:hypothetical protein